MQPLLRLTAPSTPNRENPKNKRAIKIFKSKTLNDIPKPSNYSLAYMSAPNIIVPSPTKTLIQRRLGAQFLFYHHKYCQDQ